MTLELQRLNGKTLNATLPFPDEVSALVLKAMATRVRDKPTDVADIRRCLEIADLDNSTAEPPRRWRQRPTPRLHLDRRLHWLKLHWHLA
jgi:hypothetical protein